MSVVLPMKTFGTEDIIKLIAWTQLKNYRSYRSHRKKKLAEMGVT
jgi:hypothetical protein